MNTYKVIYKHNVSNISHRPNFQQNYCFIKANTANDAKEIFDKRWLSDAENEVIRIIGV